MYVQIWLFLTLLCVFLYIDPLTDRRARAVISFSPKAKSDEFLSQVSHTQYTHCSYLDIYISQKIRLCVVDVEVQFQTSLQAESINFLIWKFRSIILIFLLFFAGIVKSTAFCTLSLLFQWVEILEFDTKILLK